MWVVDNRKAQSQTFLKYDMKNITTQLNSEERRIDNLLAAIDCSIGGMPSNYDEDLKDLCRMAKSKLDEVRRLINTCNDCVSQLEIGEWVPDDEYRYNL